MASPPGCRGEEGVVIDNSKGLYLFPIDRSINLNNFDMSIVKLLVKSSS